MNKNTKIRFYIAVISALTIIPIGLTTLSGHIDPNWGVGICTGIFISRIISEMFLS